jgi:23S rRNA (guanosine2251-2'-O)-methyltransferase
MHKNKQRFRSGAEAARRSPGASPGAAERLGGSGLWLYGLHAVRAALLNPARGVRRLLVAPDLQRELMQGIGKRESGIALPQPELAEREGIGRLLPGGAVHQGVAALVEPLPYKALEDVLAELDPERPAALLVLDQVSDPQNVGAVLRSAAAFGASGVLVTERHAAPETGALAKAASGALEIVPLLRVANLARALATIKESGLWCVGFAAEAGESLPQAVLPDRVALVLGSEGEGLRRLTRESCDLLLRLPTSGPIDQLNVSNAAAVALYDWARRR